MAARVDAGSGARQSSMDSLLDLVDFVLAAGGLGKVTVHKISSYCQARTCEAATTQTVQFQISLCSLPTCCLFFFFSKLTAHMFIAKNEQTVRGTRSTRCRQQKSCLDSRFNPICSFPFSGARTATKKLGVRHVCVRAADKDPEEQPVYGRS